MSEFRERHRSSIQWQHKKLFISMKIYPFWIKRYQQPFFYHFILLQYRSREREGRYNYPSNKGVTSLIRQTLRLLLFANTTNQSNYAQAIHYSITTLRNTYRISYQLLYFVQFLTLGKSKCREISSWNVCIGLSFTITPTFLVDASFLGRCDVRL